jgi:tetratricopeptide (TPR) repeat protein
MSGEVARRAYSNSDAATQFELALEAARHVDVPSTELIDTWSVLGDMRQLSGNPDGAIDALRRAATLAKGEPVREADLIVVRARVQARAHMALPALRATSRAQRILGNAHGEAAERVRVQADCIKALVRLDQDRPDDARATALVAADGAREVGDFETLVQALMAVDEAEHHLGIAVSGQHSREALAVCTANGMRWRESSVRLNLGAIAYFRGRWDEAIELWQTSRRVAHEAGYAAGAAEAEVNLADILISRGQLDEAERMLKDAVRVHRASRRDWWAANGELQLARVSFARGKLDEAAALLHSLIHRFAEMGARADVFEAELVLAEVVSSRGNFEQALGMVNEGERKAGEHAGPLLPRILLQRAIALEGLGRLDECDLTLESGVEAARESELLYEEALLLNLRERVARRRGDEGGEKQYAQAADALLTTLGVRS